MLNIFLFPSEIPFGNNDFPLVIVRLHSRIHKPKQSISFYDFAKNQLFTKIIVDVESMKLEDISSKNTYLSLNINKVAFIETLKNRGISPLDKVDIITCVSTSSFLLT